ncbi:glycosyltransferase [Leuconostoc gelidum]|uniref:glycosyltransferase n=1 Tax=Leuconostoc gelidum TaxID=1244 RepID=UPI001CC77C3D|nr:glycosyltransferase family 2 protein [Leuconostoc gelidum subsp. gelidum]
MKKILLVLNYNNFAQTKNFVRDALQFCFFDYIVIVDNASNNNSFQVLSENFHNNDNIVVLLSPNNSGYAGGNNFGLQYLETRFESDDVVYIANPDVSLNLKALKSINRIILEDEHIGLVTTNILDQKSAWKNLGYYKSIFIESYLFRKFFFHRYLKIKYYPELTGEKCPVDIVTGAFFATTLSTMVEIKGFDPNTFLYMEEDILAHRIKISNRQSYVLGTEQVIHEGGSSTSSVLSEIKRKKILNESKKYYYKTYLGIKPIKLLLFNVISSFDVSLLYLKKILQGK